MTTPTFSREPREPRRYVAVALDVTLARLPRVVGGAFDRVAAALGSHGLAPGGAVIRYVAVLKDGTFAIEVGHLVDGAVPRDDAYVQGELPGGEYSIARYDGPYAGMGGVTRALMESWEADGFHPAVEQTTTGEDYGCWYELYLDAPREGAQGPEGAVEVAVLSR